MISLPLSTVALSGERPQAARVMTPTARAAAVMALFIDLLPQKLALIWPYRRKAKCWPRHNQADLPLSNDHFDVGLMR
ncbi:MAG: hypothetical protein BVN33_06090 [Proteobacteria bacterium ST_bin13]|nr:MAG: hypothetical protein BVN33_06090 [Proteobacteria bacterium ST_bin13]